MSCFKSVFTQSRAPGNLREILSYSIVQRCRQLAGCCFYGNRSSCWLNYLWYWRQISVRILIIIIIIIIYLAGCTTFPHLLRLFDNYIIFFFHLSLSFQSSSINPFSSISPLISSAQVSLGLPRFLLPGGLHFITYFWQSPLFHSLNMPIPFKLFSLNIFWKRPCCIHFLFNSIIPNFYLIY